VCRGGSGTLARTGQQQYMDPRALSAFSLARLARSSCIVPFFSQKFDLPLPPCWHARARDSSAIFLAFVQVVLPIGWLPQALAADKRL